MDARTQMDSSTYCSMPSDVSSCLRLAAKAWNLAGNTLAQSSLARDAATASSVSGLVAAARNSSRPCPSGGQDVRFRDMAEDMSTPNWYRRTSTSRTKELVAPTPKFCARKRSRKDASTPVHRLASVAS